MKLTITFDDGQIFKTEVDTFDQAIAKIEELSTLDSTIEINGKEYLGKIITP